MMPQIIGLQGQVLTHEKKLRFLARKFLRLAYKVNQGYDQCWIDLQGKILFFFPLSLI